MCGQFRNADEFFGRTADEYKKWLINNTREQLDFVLLDLIRLSQDKYATDFDDILIHFTNETYHEVTDVLEDYIRKCNA